MQKICPATGLTFEPTEQEMALRKLLHVEGEPKYHPVFRFMQLNAFWQHWTLHKRKSDKSGKTIISVFPEDCPYPVWHKDEWVEHADPPNANVDLTQPIFPQLWSLFQKCPIPHNVGLGSENCEYTDDWWYSKNCYLCHSGVRCEDCRYCYRDIGLKNCQFCVYTFGAERSVDLINCHTCFHVRFSLNCWNCSDSAFLYDCRNCKHCMFSTNLRNKEYCFENEQLTKAEYEKMLKDWDLRSRKTYDKAREKFNAMLREDAWHRATFIEQSENSTGNFLEQCRNCENCYFLSEADDCANMFRGKGPMKAVLDCVSVFQNSELLYYVALPQDQCYDIKCCVNVMQCKWMEYCAHCLQCENCFGCCGLVKKKYHLFNKPYSKEAYEKEKAKIIAKMKETGEYGEFFPGEFAATPYEETLAHFHWPLEREKGKKLGFRMREKKEKRTMDALEANEVPDTSDDAGDVASKIYWDKEAERPFQVQEGDVEFSKEIGVPLPNSYYARRLKENFRYMPCNGTTRSVSCANCKQSVQTSWPEEYNGRILCESCYLKMAY